MYNCEYIFKLIFFFKSVAKCFATKILAYFAKKIDGHFGRRYI